MPAFELLAAGRSTSQHDTVKASIHGDFFALRDIRQQSLVLWNYMEGQLTKIAFPLSIFNQVRHMDVSASLF